MHHNQDMIAIYRYMLGGRVFAPVGHRKSARTKTCAVLGTRRDRHKQRTSQTSILCSTYSPGYQRLHGDCFQMSKKDDEPSCTVTAKLRSCSTKEQSATSRHASPQNISYCFAISILNDPARTSLHNQSLLESKVSHACRPKKRA